MILSVGVTFVELSNYLNPIRGMPIYIPCLEVTTLLVETFAGRNFHKRPKSKLCFAGIDFREW